jgi:peptide deformylase
MPTKRRTPRILTAPNPKLHVVCKPVTDHFEDSVVTKVVRDMLYCLNKRKKGVGLAANQIGWNLRIIIVQETTCHIFNQKCLEVKIDPVITSHSEELTNLPEGCLSYPGVTKRIKRFEWIELQWCNVFGTKCEGTFSGIEARIIQHEIAHLNGLCKVGE